MKHSIILVSSIILELHLIIKEAGIMDHATINVAQLRSYEYVYRGVNDVFTPEGTGHNW